MKKSAAIFLFLFLVVFKSYAQYLSLDELINLRGKDADAVNTYLSSKGWTFSDASEETEDKYSNSFWAYGKQLYTGRAKSFCRLMTADGYYNKIVYKTSSKEYYSLIKNKILVYKMMKMSSTPKDGYLVTVYVGSKYIIETSLSTDIESSIPIYSVFISKKSNQAAVSEYDKYNIMNEQAEAQSEEDASAPNQASEEVLQEYQIRDYKNSINGKYMPAPPTSNFMFLDEVKYGCDLIPNVSNPSNVYRHLNAGAQVYVLSRLLDESHEYYLVYAGGYYGYIKNSDLKKYAP